MTTGAVTYPNVVGTADQVLTTDGAGAATWSDPANDADWTIDGSGNMSNANSGTVSTSVDANVNSVTVGRGGGNIATNTALGTNALYSNTSGSFNTATGSQALTY
ncbi:MAG TPA: hypothetical protein EYN51_02470, partial [Flavobacteriales bacterium]|nr:hypothetical protein [Flavobacteriales bacterium]